MEHCCDCAKSSLLLYTCEIISDCGWSSALQQVSVAMDGTWRMLEERKFQYWQKKIYKINFISRSKWL